MYDVAPQLVGASCAGGALDVSEHPRGEKLSANVIVSGPNAFSLPTKEKKSRVCAEPGTLEPFGPTRSDSRSLPPSVVLRLFNVRLTDEMVPYRLVTKILDGFGDAGPKSSVVTWPKGMVIPDVLQ